MDFTTKDSGQRQEFATGAKRDTQSNKPRYALISPFAMKRLASLLARGAEKYDERNWEKGMPFSRFMESAMRHLNQYLMKEDPSEDHLAAVLFNIMAIMHFEEVGRTDLDDLPRWISERTEPSPRSNYDIPPPIQRQIFSPVYK
jgi:hypothetical protein